MSQKETLDDVAYTCMLSYPIVVSHLSFSLLCLLLLYSIYLSGDHTKVTYDPLYRHAYTERGHLDRQTHYV
jgi:hypothetical protein